MNDNAQNDGALPPDDPSSIAERVMALYQGVDRTLDELRVPAHERKEVEKNLMEAIAADLLVRLGKRLSEEERAELAGIGNDIIPGNAPNLDSVATFFKGKFSQEELMEALAQSSESVLQEFADTVGRRL